MKNSKFLRSASYIFFGIFISILGLISYQPVYAFDNWAHEKGDFAEACVNTFLLDGGWRRLDTSIGRNGLDYLGIKLKNGKVVEAIAVEIKGYSPAQPDTDTRGLVQGSKLYNEDRIDRYIKQRIDPIIESGQKAANAAKQEKAIYLQAKKLLNQEMQRSRFIECEHRGGSVFMNIYELTESGGKIAPPKDILRFNLSRSSRIEQSFKKTVNQYYKNLATKKIDSKPEIERIEEDIESGKIDSFEAFARAVEGVSQSEPAKPDQPHPDRNEQQKRKVEDLQQ